MPLSKGWNRYFRYRRNSGATMQMSGERPAGLFNALTMIVLLNCFFDNINVPVYLMTRLSVFISSSLTLLDEMA